ncbi:MAG: DNA primase [Candidatus Aquicultorales bacterium]
MSIRDEDINAVRERADLIQIISEQVALRKKGKYFWGCCPFHKEKTPSFKVDPALQLYHCFGCGEGGNVFTFVMKIDRLDFGEAVRAVADRIGYALRSDGSQAKRENARKLLDANSEAARYYQYVLTKTDSGKRALAYLKGRGFTDASIEAFQLGCATSSWDALTKNLVKRGFKQEDLVKVGLTVKGERGAYDRFRSRVIFPITDLRGRIVGFGGRVLGDESPKYLNTAETAYFKKGSMLYGLSQAKAEITKTGLAVIVEGYTDVIALHQAGVKTAVATLGTALTEEHLSLLSRFAGKVVLVFDSDAAGLKAAERSLAYVKEFRMPGLESVRDLMNRDETEVMVAVLPPGSDPADLIQKEGVDAFNRALGEARDFMEFAIERVVSRYDIASPAGKTKAVRDVLRILTTLDSSTAQAEYIRVLAKAIGLERRDGDMDFVTLELARFKSEAAKTRSVPRVDQDVQAVVEREILKIAFQHPEYRRQVARLEADHFVSEGNRQLQSVLTEVGEGKFHPDTLGDAGLAAATSGLMLEEIESHDLGNYFLDIFTKLKEFRVQRQISSLRVKLEKLNPITNTETYDALFDQLLKLESEKRSLRENTFA